MMIEERMIDIQKTEHSRLPELDFNALKFGRVFSDHMFVMNYENGRWNAPKIVPFQKLSLSPATSVIHYGQSIFEGMKAHRNEQNEVFLFRMKDNIERMNHSATRMCMPEIPEDVFRAGLVELVKLDREWIPTFSGGALYIRPFMFANEEYIGVKPADCYQFMIFTCPVGNYYTEAVKVKIETKFSRAAPGGVGYAKAAGNYGAALYPAQKANEQGYDQLIWTDSITHQYVEEAGTMNVMFMIDGKLVTPSTADTILKGITRDSVLSLARSWGIEVQERRLAVDELIDAAEKGILQEAFGVGTAATIASISNIGHGDKDYQLPSLSSEAFSLRVKSHLEELKLGKVDDPNGWITKV